jgi:BirA family biotin operon repressor/biotin-[acetyl-CoA-carboxylase] ligase
MLVNTQYRVLALLRRCDGPVSGEKLSVELGVSRVAVWKHVRELQRQGYGIEASSSGYRLVSTPDALLPGEFPGWESRIHYFPEVDSTMRLARELARRGAEEGTIVAAECQTRGRGRLDRTWLSPCGGIYMTVITRPGIGPALAPRVNLIASVSVATVLNDRFGLRARVKWPNDVLVDGRKICGILSEMEADCDAVRYVNVGMGLNINAPIDTGTAAAVSLAELVPGPVRRADIVMRVVTDLLQRLPDLATLQALDEWRELSETVGRQVCVRHGDEEVRGTAVDVNDAGALIVRTSSGEDTTVYAGDCACGES